MWHRSLTFAAVLHLPLPLHWFTRDGMTEISCIACEIDEGGVSVTSLFLIFVNYFSANRFQYRLPQTMQWYIWTLS